MLENLHTFKFVIVALNLLVLYLALRKILFKPITEFMDKRTQSIKDSISNAEKAKLEAAELKRQYELKLREAKDEADRIISEARIRAGKEYDEIMTAARQDAENVLSKAREDVERERTQMLKEIKNQVAGLALAAASKVIEANMDTEQNRKLVDKFIDESGAA